MSLTEDYSLIFANGISVKCYWNWEKQEHNRNCINRHTDYKTFNNFLFSDRIDLFIMINRPCWPIYHDK